jgi:hypothetical protein
MEGSGTGGEPAGLTDGDLDLSAELGGSPGSGFIEAVAVGIAEDEEVDVSDRTGSLVLVVAGGPGSEDEHFVDPWHVLEFRADDDWRSKGLEEDVGQLGVVGAVGVGPDQAQVAEAPAPHQTRPLCAFDLPVDGGIRQLKPFGQRGDGHFHVGVARTAVRISPCWRERRMGSRDGVARLGRVSTD